MRLTPVLAILCLGVLANTGKALAEDAGHTLEWIEATRRKGLDDYLAHQYESSERAFFQVIAADHNSPTASFAVDYLKRIMNEGGFLKSAQDKFTSLKATGDVAANPYWNPARTDIFERLKGPGRLEEHLFSMFKLGGLLAARTSLLGVLFDGLGMNEQAEYYFGQAIAIGEAAQKRAYNELRAYLLERPLQYKFAPLFQDIGILPYTASGLQIIPFENQQQSDPDIEVQRNPYHPSTHLFFGLFSRYDSNIVKSPKGVSNPTGAVRPEGADNSYLANVGVQSDPSQEITYGGDYFLWINDHSRDDLNPYETVTHIASGWASWWNRRDTELKLRYDYALSMHDAQYTEVYTTSQGPQLTWSRLWNQRYRADISYSYKLNHDANDPEAGSRIRSGTEHVLSAQISYPGKKRMLQPFFRYSYDRNLATGSDFSSVANKFEVGTAYLIGKHSVLSASTIFWITNYPFYPGERLETAKGLKVQLAVPITERFLTFIVDGSFVDQGSEQKTFEYQRYLIGGGLVVSL